MFYWTRTQWDSSRNRLQGAQTQYHFFADIEAYVEGLAQILVCDCEGIISQECIFPVLFLVFFAFWNYNMFLFPMPLVVSSVLSHPLGLKAHKIWLHQPHSVECDMVRLSLLQWAELVWRIYLDHVILSPSTVFKIYFYLFEVREDELENEHSGTCLMVFICWPCSHSPFYTYRQMLHHCSVRSLLSSASNP